MKLKLLLLFVVLFSLNNSKAQDIQLVNKIVGNGDPTNYYIGHFPVSGSDGLDLHWYGGIRFGDQTSNSVMQITNGKVGIGTISPAQKLSVYDSNFGIASFLGGKVSGNYQYSQIYIGQQLAVGYGANIGYMAHQTDQTASGFYMTNYGESEGSTGIFIRKGGNVGIGTATPSAKLDVNGSIYSNANILSDSFGGYSGGDTELTTNTGGVANLKFKTQQIERMRINALGNVGIGSTNPDQKLTVKGKIHAEEIIVDLAVPADYVFQKYYTGKSNLKSDYVMPTLAEIESFTKKNHHLPNVPSAQEVQQNGVSLGEMSNVLLQKVEELTLYAIEQNKVIEELKAQVTALMAKSNN